MPQAHGNTPMRHSTFRITLADLLELSLRFLVPKRVQQRDAALKAFLYGGIA